MNKIPFVIIGVLLVTAIFIAVFSQDHSKNPLAALGDTTPTPPVNIYLNGQNNQAGQQAAQQQAQTQQQQSQQVQGAQTQQTQQQAQQQAQQQIPPTQPPIPTAVPSDIISAHTGIIHTTKGDIEITFYPDDAPKTVKNFATLSKKGYYNGLIFHRVEPGFVIQGGDPTGTGAGGSSIYGPTFEDELNPETASYKEGYKEGVVAMANRGPNTNSSQFFIMLADNDSLPKNYTIFGKVTQGMDVVHKIVVGDKMTTIEVSE